jgi:hypothetical protein
MRSCTLILVLSSLCFSHLLMSQTGYGKAVAAYHEAIGAQAGIYNGLLYQPLTNIREGHPYFDSASMLNGSVFYDGVLYLNMPLALDEVQDALITKDHAGRHLIQLIKEKVGHFTINGQPFIKRSAGSAESYYQLLYSGNSKLLKKEEKTVSKRIVNDFDIQWIINARTRYFVDTGGRFIEIKTRRSLLSLFAQHRGAVKRHMNTTRLKYKRDRDEYLKQAVKHYDELSR